jgi:hypothetical protein
MARGNLTKKERVRRAMVILGPDARLADIAYLANLDPIGAVRIMKQLHARQTAPTSTKHAHYPVRGSGRWTLPSPSDYAHA